MPYTIDWLIPDEVLYAHYSGVTTPEELRQSLAAMQDLIEGSPRELVHTISDVGDIDESVPLREAMKVIRETGTHPRSGWAISIRERSPLVKMGAAVGASIFRLRFRAFATMDEAIEHLKFVDKNLSWDKVNKDIAGLADA